VIPELPGGWAPLLSSETGRAYFGKLRQYVAMERREHDVFPPADETFAALQLTPPTAIRAVILGQDPYHGPGQAHGLSFSVRPGVPVPPSLRNIYRELHTDLGLEPVNHGDLTAWARRGVLLLNSALTVRAHEPASHAASGWAQFTDRVLSLVAQLQPDAVFMLWGNTARAKRPLLGAASVVVESVHPSPLSAHRGFFGSRPFSRCNDALARVGADPIDWRLS